MTDTDFEGRVARLFTENVDARAATSSAPARFDRPKRRRPTLWLSIGAAVALIAGLAVAVVVRHDRNDAADGRDPHHTLTVKRVAAALDHVTVLPGAIRHDRSPYSDLDEAGEQPATGERGLQLTRWWTAETSLTDAVRYYRSHIPHGFTAGAYGTSGARQMVGYDGPSDQATGALTLQVGLVAHGSRVGVRVDVFAEWYPTRSRDTMIVDPSRVDVALRKDMLAPVRRRTLGASPAVKLAAVVNALPPASTGLYSCPADFGGYDELRFTTKTGVVVVRGATSGCRGVTMTAPGREPVALQGGNLVAAVQAALAER